MQKITTPDGDLPHTSNPVEGVDYTVVNGSPVTGDMVKICGTFKWYTEPATKTPAPVVFSKTQYQDHCFDQLGGGSTGMIRYGAIMKAARSSTNDGVVACMERYAAANSVEKNAAAVFIAFLVAAAIATQQEADNVINNWPVV